MGSTMISAAATLVFMFSRLVPDAQKAIPHMTAAVQKPEPRLRGVQGKFASLLKCRLG